MAAYEPAVRLIEILYACSALSLDEGGSRVSLPGFLFDMNRFFQTLVARFLGEHLPGHELYEEHVLSDMMRYVPGLNPLRRRPPRPRPDFMVKRRGKVVALLDAKYRDPWEHELPRDMLYQLSVYALSQPPVSTAAILYPTLCNEAREAAIEIVDPVCGESRGFVGLRPVVLTQLGRIVSSTVSRTG